MNVEAYYLRIGLVVGFLAIAVWKDLQTRQIPNVLTFSAAAAGIAVASMFEGQQGVFWALQGLLAGIVLFLPFYALGAVGAGDVKLLGAVGTCLGAAGVILAGALSLVAGSLIGAFIWLKNRRQPAATNTKGAGLPIQSNAGMPYAPAIALGCVGLLLWSAT